LPVAVTTVALSLTIFQIVFLLAVIWYLLRR
jgi:cbb3-type cytochrome oxidase subunit 3